LADAQVRPGHDRGKLAGLALRRFLLAAETLQAGLVHLGLFAALLLLAFAAFPVLEHEFVFLELAEGGIDLFLGRGDAIDHLLARGLEVGAALAVRLAVAGEAETRLVMLGRDLAFLLQFFIEPDHLALDAAAQDLEIDDDAPALVETPFPHPYQSVHAAHAVLPIARPGRLRPR